MNNNTATNTATCPTVRKQIGKTTYIAVSYTHLDVYKRQVLQCLKKVYGPKMNTQRVYQSLPVQLVG